MSYRPSSLLAAALFVPGLLAAQSLDLTVRDYGISIGDSRFVRGVRLNFRDRNLERVVGINATIWSPYQPATGVVQGIALGLPATGARRIEGAGLAVLGVSAEEDFRGLGIGLGGVGAGGSAKGILIGGFGVGAGGEVSGLTIGGFGAGSGGNITGITLGGFGAGAGGNITGFTFGGFGAGAGGDIKGITIAGFGAGAGGDITGFTFGPAWFKVNDDGRVKGVTLSAFNQVKGDQAGLSIGLLNYAWHADGLQIGVLNYVADNTKGLRLLPLFNRSW
jgi:hypothetical protein